MDMKSDKKIIENISEYIHLVFILEMNMNMNNHITNST